jgi:hypothetical protein
MSDRFDDLPAEIQERVRSFMVEHEDGTYDVPDRMALVGFIVENADAYPALWNLVKVNEERVIEYAKRTGEIPPGIKIVKTRTVEGENVTDVRIFHGPTTIPEEDRD